MSFPAGPHGLRVHSPGGPMKSNPRSTHLHLPAPSSAGGDANANVLAPRGEDAGDSSSPLPPLLSQDKLLIWGTEGSGSLASVLDPGSQPLDLRRTRTHNHNSPPTPPFPAPPRRQEVPPYRQEERRLHGNGAFPTSCSVGGAGPRRREEEKQAPPPPRRQQLGHHGNGGATHFTFLPEPTDVSHLHASSGPRLPCGAPSQGRPAGPAPQREARPLGRTSSGAGQTSSPSGQPSTLDRRPQTHLTYRRHCFSPNRVSPNRTPPQSPHASPRRQPSMYVTSRVGPPQSGYAPGPGGTLSSLGLRPPVKTSLSTSGIPKPPLSSQQTPTNARESSLSPKSAPKPKGVRPKIITYIRKSPQIKPQASDGPYQVSSLPSRLTAYTPSSFLHHTQKEGSKAGPGEQRGPPVLSASNQLYEKYRQEIQRGRLFPSGGHRPPSAHIAGHTHTHSHTAPPKLGCHGDSFYGPLTDKCQTGRAASFGGGSGCEDPVRPKMAAQTGNTSGSLLRSARGLRLGLGAVTRTTPGPAKSRGPSQVQRSTLTFSQPVQAVAPATSMMFQENSVKGTVKHTAMPNGEADPRYHSAAGDKAPLSLPRINARCWGALAGELGVGRTKVGLFQIKPLTPSPYPHPHPNLTSNLTSRRLAAFGFVSSVQSGHSAESDPCRPAHREVTPPSQVVELQRGGPCRSSSLQPPSTPALPRRFLPAQPRSSPGVGRKEFQRSSEVTRSLPSSPKRLAVVPPKPQSPGQPAHRPAAAVKASVPPGSPRRIAPFREQQENLQREKEEAQQQEREKEAQEREKEAQEREKEREEEREEVQRLKCRCEQQETQLIVVREELRKATLGLEAFIISTQYYSLKSENTDEKEKQLCGKMEKLSDNAAFHFAQWECLQREKEALEAGFERELQEMQLLQEEELAAVEEELRKCHSAETDHLRAEHQSEVEELRTQQQEQMEELSINHLAAIQELRDMHNITMATLHEEHARTMRDLRKAHEQQKAFLEEDSEKLRLSMQDQVDTLTFQNHGLRDKAQRFEEALKRSNEEQIVDVLAPYRHIEEDLRSVKDVLEMKNHQIHQQEKKIAELGIVQAQKNVFLEERVQLLQQQNEDLKARVDKNLTLSRHLSEENANLQDTVEKESSEKKRLSQNNEELLWRLQTSPLTSPFSSPLHRSFSPSPVPSSPSPATGFFHSPTHCCGCPRPATPTHCSSHAHRAGTNQNLSPGPGTPTHRASSNQNYSPGPATPTHRGSTNHCLSPAHLNSLQR
ncbi:microtubule-associated tumor suppressor candidate 2 homolog [Aplochiton taeniatus]